MFESRNTPEKTAKKKEQHQATVLHDLDMDLKEAMETTDAMTLLRTLASIQLTARVESAKTDTAYRQELKKRNDAANGLKRAFVTQNLPQLSITLERDKFFATCPGLRQTFNEEFDKAHTARLEAERAAHETATAERLVHEAVVLREIDDAANKGDISKAYAIAHIHFASEIAEASPAYSEALTSRYTTLQAQNEAQVNAGQGQFLWQVDKKIRNIQSMPTVLDKVRALEELRTDVTGMLSVTHNAPYHDGLMKRYSAISTAELDAATQRKTWDSQVALNEEGVAEAVLAEFPALKGVFQKVIEGKTVTVAEVQQMAGKSPAVTAKAATL